MKTALVTGASGFLGPHAMRALRRRGFRVYAFSRRPPDDGFADWCRVDLFDGEAVSRTLETLRPTHLLHLAWEVAHGRFWESPENLRWVEATLSLCRRFHEAGGRRIVGAGTCAEYAWDSDGLGTVPIEEHRSPRRPTHLYGVAKNATFDVLSAWADRVGLDFAWGRIFFPYGASDRPTVIPSIVRALAEGRPALCTHGRQQRDFIHVRDVGEAFAALLESEVTGPVNIASGTVVSIADVATQIGAALGRPDLIRLGALEARPNEPPCLAAAVTRLREEVGYVPKVGLAEGLNETIEGLLKLWR